MGSRSLRLTGTITRIEWSNPHSYFFIDVKDEKGNVANWGCEGAGPGALTRRGWKKGDVKLGDTLIPSTAIRRQRRFAISSMRGVSRSLTAARFPVDRRATAARGMRWRSTTRQNLKNNRSPLNEFRG